MLCRGYCAELSALIFVDAAKANPLRVLVRDPRTQALLKNFVIFCVPGFAPFCGLFDVFCVALIFPPVVRAFFGDGASLASSDADTLRFSSLSGFVGDFVTDLSSALASSSPAEGCILIGDSFFSGDGCDFVGDASFFPPAFAKKFAMLDLFSLLFTGITNDGELFPTLPTSLLTGYTSSSPSNGLRSDWRSRDHSCREGSSQVLRSSEPGLRMTGMRSWRNLSCLLESVVMMV